MSKKTRQAKGHDPVIQAIVDREAKEKRWTVVSDSDVRHIWQCENDECDQDNPCDDVNPAWYQHNGTPTCGCGRDMVYVRTEIFK